MNAWSLPWPYRERRNAHLRRRLQSLWLKLPAAVRSHATLTTLLLGATLIMLLSFYAVVNAAVQRVEQQRLAMEERVQACSVMPSRAARVACQAAKAEGIQAGLDQQPQSEAQLVRFMP